MRLKILVVEDDREIRAMMQSSLSVEGFDVQTAVSLSEARALLQHAPPDVIVLDLGLPDGDGVELVQQVRQQQTLPIIIVSARHQEAQKIRMLDAGADDYLAKPFHTEELLARLRGLIRRASGHASPVLVCGPVELDTRSSRVTLNGQHMPLTSHEYKVLAYLMHHPGAVVSRSELTEHIYAQDFDRDSNTIEVFVGRLRKKLGTQLIETVRGLGYRLSPPP